MATLPSCCKHRLQGAVADAVGDLFSGGRAHHKPTCSRCTWGARIPHRDAAEPRTVTSKEAPHGDQPARRTWRKCHRSVGGRRCWSGWVSPQERGGSQHTTAERSPGGSRCGPSLGLGNKTADTQVESLHRFPVRLRKCMILKSAPTTTCTGETVTNTEASTLQKGPLPFWKIPSKDARAAKRPLGGRHLAHYIVGIDAVARIESCGSAFFACAT